MTSPALGVGAPVGEIYDECVRQLERWRDRYRGRPDRERRRLWLLALEREQVVHRVPRERHRRPHRAHAAHRRGT
jgi:hypothetical protein